MNNLVFIGIIVVLIIILIYIFITKNQEIDDLTKKNSTSSETVDVELYNKCIQDFQSLTINFNELQEQTLSTTLSGLDSLAEYISGEQRALSELLS